MVGVGGVRMPIGAFGAMASQVGNEATKEDDNKEDAREPPAPTDATRARRTGLDM